MKITMSNHLRIAACALLCTAAAAQEPTLSRTVGYADLNITQMAGAKVLYRRIEAAAHQVCPIDDPRNLAARETHDNCVKQAVDEAVKGVNSPLLSSLHAGGALRLASN